MSIDNKKNVLIKSIEKSFFPYNIRIYKNWIYEKILNLKKPILSLEFIRFKWNEVLLREVL